MKALTRKELTAKVEELQQQIDDMQGRKTKKEGAPSINKLETFNGVVEPERSDNLKMTKLDMIQSMHNIMDILPPNLIDDDTGQHTMENVGRLCAFKLNDEIYEEAVGSYVPRDQRGD